MKIKRTVTDGQLSTKNQKMLAFLERRLEESKTEKEDPTWVEFEEKLRERRKAFKFREISWDD